MATARSAVILQYAKFHRLVPLKMGIMQMYLLKGGTICGNKFLSTEIRQNTSALLMEK